METRKYTKHLIYWMLPLFVMLPCIIIYFYDIAGMAKYIAPEFNREFGLVENLQLVLLACIFMVALNALQRKKSGVEKYGYTLVAISAVFFFFEEIDYGLHYYELIAGKTKEEVEYQVLVQRQLRNIHNIGKMNSVIKFLVYTFTVILFVVMPLLPKKTLQSQPWLKYFAASRYIVVTAIILFLLNQAAQYLDTLFHEKNIALAGNTSEFEEVMNYYIFLLYIREMIKKTEPVPPVKWRLAYFCGWRTKSQQ